MVRGKPRDGFDTADISTRIFEDPKFRKLARKHLLDAELACCILTYLYVMLGSWEEGRRVPASEIEGWIELAPWIPALQEAKLLDSSGRIPEAVWEGWYGPARDRRERLRNLNPSGIGGTRERTYGERDQGGQSNVSGTVSGTGTGVSRGTHLGGRWGQRDNGTLDPIRQILAGGKPDAPEA